jgi:hypothetical protein
VNGGKRWSSFNLYKTDNGTTTNPSNTAAVLTKNPLAFGSYFKRLNVRDGILESNNDKYGIMQNPGSLSLTTGASAEWAKITNTTTVSYTKSWGQFTSTVNGQERNYRVAGYDDCKALDDAEFGFGVLYGDGATRTASTVEEAYGYDQGQNDVTRSTKGTRGVIVYSRDTGNQIFFPMGKKGMGRRTEFNIDIKNYPGRAGYLRYGDVYNPLIGDKNYTRPIPYNLPYATGAIYWTDIIREKGHIEPKPSTGEDEYTDTAGWDMNYFSFDFGSYTRNNVSDACPIRFVIDEK